MPVKIMDGSEFRFSSWNSSAPSMSTSLLIFTRIYVLLFWCHAPALVVLHRSPLIPPAFYLSCVVVIAQHLIPQFSLYSSACPYRSMAELFNRCTPCRNPSHRPSEDSSPRKTVYLPVPCSERTEQSNSMTSNYVSYNSST